MGCDVSYLGLRFLKAVKPHVCRRDKLSLRFLNFLRVDETPRALSSTRFFYKASAEGYNPDSPQVNKPEGPPERLIYKTMYITSYNN